MVDLALCCPWYRFNNFLLIKVLRQNINTNPEKIWSSPTERPSSLGLSHLSKTPRDITFRSRPAICSIIPHIILLWNACISSLYPLLCPVALSQMSISQQTLNEHLAQVKIIAAKGTERVLSPWLTNISHTHVLHIWPTHCQEGWREDWLPQLQIHGWALGRSKNSWNYYKILLMYLAICIFLRG